MARVALRRPRLQLDLSVCSAPLHFEPSTPQYHGICSQIIDGLYLGDQWVAQNQSLLSETGITHILNCAALPCYFPSLFTYKTISLRESKCSDDLFCHFFEAIDFIENALRCGRLLVHCERGVSRSVVMIVCYLMYKNNWTYEYSLQYVKQIRPNSDPTASYALGLIEWQKNLLDPLETPRVYVLGPSIRRCSLLCSILHPITTNDKIICRVFQTLNSVFVWVGSNCSTEYLIVLLDWQN